MNNNIILDVQNLKTSFFTQNGEVKVIDGVSFFLRKGETLGIVGESGCGKSMTALSILRLLPEPAGKVIGGRVFLDGQDLLALTKKQMRAYRGKKISMILQDPMTSLNPSYTIGNQISEAIRTHQNIPKSKIKDQVIQSLKLLQIPAPETRLNDYPFQLSGGMKQRIVGAIAMSCNPEVLIADEPTTALDATIQMQYIALFQDIQKKTNVSIIFITHDFGVVSKLCHRVAVMYAGKIVETAVTKNIFKTPKHPYTKALINSVPKLEQKNRKLFSIDGQPPSLLNLSPGCRFAPRCSLATEKCRVQEPDQVETGSDHFVSCWNAR